MQIPFSHTVRHRVLYAEADQMGYAHHSHYPVWFERARIELLRQQGISYRDLEAGGIILPVTEMRVRFLSAARFDDELDIAVTLHELGRVMIGFQYTVTRRGDGARIAEAEVTLAFCNSAGRPIRHGPETLRQMALRAAGSPA